MGQTEEEGGERKGELVSLVLEPLQSSFEDRRARNRKGVYAQFLRLSSVAKGPISEKSKAGSKMVVPSFEMFC